MVPQNMETRDNEERGRAIVQTFAAVVETMVQPSESVPSAYLTRTKFEAFRSPGISIRDYLMRIHKYANCSPECFVLALVYIDRLHEHNQLILTDLNVHRVLITSVVLAAKFFDDHYFNNAYYAKVGGVPCSEMNELELEFLLMVNFTLHVSTDVYIRYYGELSTHYVFTTLRNSRSRFKFSNHVAMDPKQDGQLIYVAGGETEDDQHVYNHHESLLDQHQPAQAHPVYSYQQQTQPDQARPAHVFLPQTEPVYGYKQQQAHQHQPYPVYAYQREQSQSFVQPHQQPYPPQPSFGFQQQSDQVAHVNPYANTHSAAAPHPPYNDQSHSQTFIHNQRSSREECVTSHHSSSLAAASGLNPYANHYTAPPLHPTRSGNTLVNSHRSSIDVDTAPDQRSSTVAPVVNGKIVAPSRVAPAVSVSASSSSGVVYANSSRTSGQKRSQSVALGVNA